MQTTIMTVQAARSVAPQRPEIRFLETAANTPPAIATWWYPGQTQGWEFIYPRQQAMTLARPAKEPILTTKEDVPADKIASSDLVRMEPSGSQSAYSDTAAPAPTSIAGTASAASSLMSRPRLTRASRPARVAGRRCRNGEQRAAPRPFSDSWLVQPAWPSA